jgi:hypothetical protein
VPGGTTKVEIRMAYTFRAGGDLDLRLYDRTGAPLVQSVGFGNEEVITCPGRAPVCPMLAAGDYVFEVFPVAASVNPYTIALAITP